VEKSRIPSPLVVFVLQATDAEDGGIPLPLMQRGNLLTMNVVVNDYCELHDDLQYELWSCEMYTMLVHRALLFAHPRSTTTADHQYVCCCCCCCCCCVFAGLQSGASKRWDAAVAVQNAAPISDSKRWNRLQSEMSV
jgi:hypothetical protein